MRRRLDVELVRRGLVTSRSEAADAVAAARVLVSGTVASKITRLVDAGEPIEFTGPARRFVSRGGDKLAGALDDAGLDVAGVRALDAGASTGGFTDCLLQRGAAEVVAVDVGHGQLHERLRADPRVIVRERCNVRDLDAASLGGTVDLVVADLSFISLRTVLPALLACCRPHADLLLLVKPQFEAGRQEAAKGRGVIRDPAVHERVRTEIDDALRAAAARVRCWTTSRLLGADGNTELFVHAVAP
ncbi:MAG: TlyA family RNA methyltransferase [Acidimicrobiales bacterium]